MPPAPADPEPGQLRLLDVDERLVLPTNSLVRLLVTSNDVIHSWAVPSLGVKMDAIPGRLNQVGPGALRPCSPLPGCAVPVPAQTAGPLAFSATRPATSQSRSPAHLLPLLPLPPLPHVRRCGSPSSAPACSTASAASCAAPTTHSCPLWSRR